MSDTTTTPDTTRTAARDDILAARTSLGIELGSTRIKACLIGSDATLSLIHI